MPNIYRSSGNRTIDITLTPADFKRNWSAFLTGLKSCDHHEYNPETKTWSIPNTDFNFAYLAELIDKYLTEKNPLEIGGLF